MTYDNPKSWSFFKQPFVLTVQHNSQLYTEKDFQLFCTCLSDDTVPRPKVELQLKIIKNNQ